MKRAAAGLIAGAFMLVSVLSLAFVAGCWTAGAGDPSAWDIHNQFPEPSGGWLMVTNRATSGPEGPTPRRAVKP